MAGKVLVFPGEEALIAALTSDLIPADIQARPAQAWLDGDGAIVVRPAEPPGKDVVRGLKAAGVQWVARTPAAGQAVRQARIWPELVLPRRSAPGAGPGAGIDVAAGPIVLFYMATDAGKQPGRTLLDLAAELLRLGCDRASYRLLRREGQGGQDLALVRAYDPPYYTVAATSDRDAGYRAFVPIRAGQTRTWIELGFTHPLGHAITPAEGCLGLLMGDGTWVDVPDEDWHDMFEFIELTVPGGTHAYEPLGLEEKLTVQLRLAPATRTEAPSLWVMRTSAAGDRTFYHPPGHAPGNAVDEMERLVEALPDHVISRLLFAVLGPASEPTVIIRARLGRDGPPEIEVAGTPMVPLLGIGNLYVPHDAMVEPPLRRDSLRPLLAPLDDRLYWLLPTGQRGFRVESAPEAAFSPLGDWVEYLVHRSADELAPWVRAVTFEFEPFQSTGTEWAQAAQIEAKGTSEEPRQRPQRTRLRTAPPIPPAPGTHEAESRTAGAEAASDAPDEAHEPGPDERTAAVQASSLDSELARLEQQFLDSDAPADDPARIELWHDMARMLHALGRHKDAALCFVRAVWELPRQACKALVAEWAAAEARAQGSEDLAELLWSPLQDRGDEEPTSDQVRAVAVQWIATVLADLDPGEPPGGSRRDRQWRGRAMLAIQQWLDAHDGALDVRTLWLVRWSLAAHLGGDPLGLARTRDRVLKSLHRGLSLTRDVPTFLRFLGSPGSGHTLAIAPLAHGLESLISLFDRTRRQRSAIEAPTALTRSYVLLVIAYGLARLGQAERALTLRQEAIERLDADDPVHGFLTAAYGARMEQALEGLPPETPLPAEITAMLVALEDGKDRNQLARYKVDRLRQASVILEPHERIDAIHGFLRRRREPGGEEWTRLRGMEAGELGAEVTRLLGRAMDPDTAVSERVRLFDGLMDVFPMLPDSVAVPALRRIVDAAAELPAPSRTLLLEEALMLAGYFGREELAAEIAGSMAGLVAELSAGEAEALAPELGASLHSLRRVGLRDQAAQLIDALTAKITGEGILALEARLHLAAGLAYLGHFAEAQPILSRAQEILDTAELKVVDQRLRLVRALARAYAECPRAEAVQGLGALSAQLARITDNYNTNTHFCLSVIAFMEALVLGYAKSDLALGELGRRWLDEDEYLVRRRIHRELGGSP